MISKPLFKQSCKANASIWTFVTSITCAMLAILILVLGNLNVGTIRNSMVDMFIEDTIESTVKKQSMTFFNMTENALDGYEENSENLKILFGSMGSKETITANYQTLVDGGMSHEQACDAITGTISDASQKQATQTLLDYYSVKGNNYGEQDVNEYVLNQIKATVYNQILESDGLETANQAKDFISSATTAYLAQNENTTDFATTYIPTVVKNTFISQSFEYQDRTISVSDYFTADELEDQSLSAIVVFKSESDIKKKQFETQISTENPTFSDEQKQSLVSAKLAEFRSNYIAESSGGLLEDLPEDVSDALIEVGEMDIYSLVIGSIFFKIAGLLLPIIFVIMCSNNLISSQVDSGSMAYILSTPTKRRNVAVTQMLYLIGSIFAMCCLTTLTGIICLALVKNSEVTITMSQMILFNLGLFITLFAISGICYLASCWFSRSKQAMSIGGGLSMFFLVATILGLFGSKVIPSAIRIDAMNFFNYVSLISLFDTISIIDGTLTFLWKWVILLVVGVVTYTIGIEKFNRKDLPL